MNSQLIRGNNMGQGDKRLTVELKNENEVSTVRKFKSLCVANGTDMRTVVLSLIKEYLKKG